MTSSPESPARPALPFIVGARGVVGGALAAYHRARDPSLVTAVRRASGPHEIELDLSRPRLDAEALVQRGYRRAVIAAGVGDVGRCEAQPAETRSLNVDATVDLARQLLRAGFESVAVLSTSYVFDGRRGAYDEHDDRRPVNEYGRQKCELEDACLDLGPGLLVVRPGKLVPETGSFLHDLVTDLAAGRRVRVAHDQRLNPTSLEDFARALDALQERRVGGLVHVASPESFSRLDLARIAEQAVGAGARAEPMSLAELDLHPPRPLDTTLRIDRLESLVKVAFRPLRPWIEEMARARRAL